MKKITFKHSLMGGIALGSLCLIIYKTLPDQTSIHEILPANRHTETSLQIDSVPAQAKKSLEIEAEESTEKLSGDTIAYQTPKTFPNGPFAPSIADTEIDGSLKADANGNLIIDLATRDLFDYFMNTVADVPPEVAIAELEKLARDNLPETTVNQVMSLLADYLLYKETALEFSSQPLIPADQQDENYQLKMLEASFERLKDIRRSTMSNEAVEAFFGLEEAYGEFTLASIKIQQNPDLSPEQIQIELQSQRELLPEAIRNTENRMVTDIENSQEINDVLLSDKRDNEIETILREKGLTDSAVEDALAYRKQQQEFEAQYALYKQERDQLISASLSEEDMASQKERLLQKYFNSEQAITQAKVKDLSS